MEKKSRLLMFAAFAALSLTMLGPGASGIVPGPVDDGHSGVDAPEFCTPGPVAPFIPGNGATTHGSLLLTPLGDQKDVWTHPINVNHGQFVSVVITPQTPGLPLYAGVRPPNCGPLLVTTMGPDADEITLTFDPVDGPGLYKVIVGVWPPPDMEEASAARPAPGTLPATDAQPRADVPLSACGDWCYFIRCELQAVTQAEG